MSHFKNTHSAIALTLVFILVSAFSVKADNLSLMVNQVLSNHEDIINSKKELEESRQRVQDQCIKSEEFGKNIGTVFEDRDHLHDEHIVLIEKADTAANVMIQMQEKMLGNKKCACLIIDIRSFRRMLYFMFGLFVIYLLINNIIQMAT